MRIKRIIKMGIIVAMSACVLIGCGQESKEVTTPAVDTTPVSASIETICDELQSCSMDGIIYYQLNPENYNEVAESNISFGQVTRENVDAENVKVTLPVSITMKGKYTSDCMDYSGCITPSFELFDRYTSVVFPVNTGVGNGSYNYSGAIKSRDKSVNVSYDCQYSIVFSEWNSLGNDTFDRDIIVSATYSVTMPSDYDGLAIKVTPVRQYSTGISEATGAITYVQDDYPEGTRVFSIK